MSVTRHKVKACCGSTTFVFIVDKPVKKIHIELFEKSGYIAPRSYVTAGVFYITKSGLVATSSFGATTINIRCHGNNCNQLLDDFAIDLDRIVHS